MSSCGQTVEIAILLAAFRPQGAADTTKGRVPFPMLAGQGTALGHIVHHCGNIKDPLLNIVRQLGCSSFSAASQIRWAGTSNIQATSLTGELVGVIRLMVDRKAERIRSNCPFVTKLSIAITTPAPDNSPTKPPPPETLASSPKWVLTNERHSKCLRVRISQPLRRCAPPGSGSSTPGRWADNNRNGNLMS